MTPDPHTYAKARRDRLRAAGLCLSGERHGPATHGVLCARCRIVHNRGLLAAERQAVQP